MAKNAGTTSLSNEKTDSEYGEAYLNWKGWRSDNFGELTKLQKRYFDAEIRKSKFGSHKEIRVLEIGFGNGSFLAYARTRGWDIVGIEANNDLVQTAIDHDFNAICTDSLTTFEDRTFDLIVAFDVLEHIGQEDLLNFLSEVKRIQKNNGVFIARFPNGDSPFGLMYQNGDVTHITTIGSIKARYFVDVLGVDLIFLGGEAQPLFSGSLLVTTHRLFALPIRKLANLLVNLVFLPGRNVAFSSPNLVMIFRSHIPN